VLSKLARWRRKAIPDHPKRPNVRFCGPSGPSEMGQPRQRPRQMLSKMPGARAILDKSGCGLLRRKPSKCLLGPDELGFEFDRLAVGRSSFVRLTSGVHCSRGAELGRLACFAALGNGCRIWPAAPCTAGIACESLGACYALTYYALK